MTWLFVPSWGFEHGAAEYYGWRNWLHIGPLIIAWGVIDQGDVVDEYPEF